MSLTLGCFALRISANARSLKNRRARSSMGTRRSRVIATALAAAAGVLAMPELTAVASTSGVVNATIPVAPGAVRSVAVSPNNVTYSCSSGSLTLPNGICNFSNSPGITVTNGGVSAHIDVNGADAVPSDNQTHWTLCGSAGPACSGANSAPGANQYAEQNYSCATTSASTCTYPPLLNNSPQCDTTFNPANSTDPCSAAVGVSQHEGLYVEGPQSSIDTSPTFTTPITWTAVP